MKKLSNRSTGTIALVLALAVGGLVFAFGGKDHGASNHAAIGASTPSPTIARKAGDIIPGEYIVTFKPGIAGLESLVTSLLSGVNGVLQHSFSSVLHGFSAKLTSSAAALLKANPAVAAVEPNRVVTATSVQTSASWGLGRISADQVSPNGIYNTYSYPAAESGAGVAAYVMDTGINLTHGDFGGRATWGYTDPRFPSTKVDGNGHGTLIAGIIGGKTYGVAKQVKLIAVKVLADDGSGSESGVIAGLDWIRTHQTAGVRAVTNISFGGGLSVAFNAAVTNLVAAGVAVVVSAGNDNADACNYSPGSAPTAITVGSTDTRDTKAPFSNFGKCVDIQAPGVNNKGPWTGSTTATNVLSGTSQSAAYVAGVVARWLSLYPSRQPSRSATMLTGNALVGIVKNLPAGTPNLLLHAPSTGIR